MKKIVCELCEGMQFDKVDGRFVCKGCGTSYSAEEARGMMREVEGEDIPVATGAPAPAVSMPQGNPNQQQLDNILMLATSAYEADNKSEAENYCNQAIVLDAMCYKAWFLKGKAVGWQSTMANLRIEEAAHSFCKAIDFAPEDEKESLKEQAVQELKNLGLALISLRRDRFIKSPDAEELTGFKRDRKVLIDALMVLLSHGNAVGIPDGYLEEIAKLMNEAGVGAINTVRAAWENVDHPSKKDFDTFMNWNTCICSIFQEAIDVSDDDDEEDIRRYKNLIIAWEDPIEMDIHSEKREWLSYAHEYIWFREYSLSDSAKQSRQKNIQKCKDAIAKIKRDIQAKKEAELKKAAEEKQARLDAYWADPEHAAEKAQLDAEKAELTEKVSAINKELTEITGQINAANRQEKEQTPSEAELSKVQDQIRDLNNERARLGMFQGGRKKEINSQIEILEARVSSLKEKAQQEKEAKKAEINQKLAPAHTKKRELETEVSGLQKRISEINKRLTEDPAEE